jgi:hypothetical protein
MTQVMAAVLALVMLPVVAAIGFFVSVVSSDHSWGSGFAGLAFVALAIGVLYGALRITREAEGEEPDHALR